MSTPDVTSRLMVFLFTDLVDSTAMKQRLGDGDYVRGVLQPHNAIFRELLATFAGGNEQDNAGDGFFVTFGGLSEAVRMMHVIQAKPSFDAQALLVRRPASAAHIEKLVILDVIGELTAHPAVRTHAVHAAVGHRRAPVLRVHQRGGHQRPGHV